MQAIISYLITTTATILFTGLLVTLILLGLRLINGVKYRDTEKTVQGVTEGFVSTFGKSFGKKFASMFFSTIGIIDIISGVMNIGIGILTITVASQGLYGILGNLFFYVIGIMSIVIGISVMLYGAITAAALFRHGSERSLTHDSTQTK